MIHQHSFTEGYQAETFFRKLAESNGYTISVASSNQNIKEHWDLEIQKEGERYKVDVKAAKRNHRRDTNVQNQFIWVEFRNVRGEGGWLYGKADLIAFEIENEFWLVKRTSLVDLVDKLVDKSQLATNASEALYRIYTRHGRYDQISKIQTTDLNPIIWQKWTKLFMPK